MQHFIHLMFNVKLNVNTDGILFYSFFSSSLRLVVLGSRRRLVRCVCTGDPTLLPGSTTTAALDDAVRDDDDNDGSKCE